MIFYIYYINTHEKHLGPKEYFEIILIGSK